MLVNSYFIKEKGMGLGDFIRGSIASQQLCIEYGLHFQVDLSHHPMGKYIIQRCDAPAPSIDSILNLQDVTQSRGSPEIVHNMQEPSPYLHFALVTIQCELSARRAVHTL